MTEDINYHTLICKLDENNQWECTGWYTRETLEGRKTNFVNLRPIDRILAGGIHITDIRTPPLNELLSHDMINIKFTEDSGHCKIIKDGYRVTLECGDFKEVWEDD